MRRVGLGLRLLGLLALVITSACSPAAATPAPTAVAQSQNPTAAPAAATATTAPTEAPAATATTAPTDAPTATSAATIAPATQAPTVTVPPPSETPKPTPRPEPGKMTLATTTSTADSGLLTAILPYFEAAENVKVKVIAVGTGQALAIGAKGDADVVLVHARSQEDAFVAAGNGIDRRDVMHNDFVLVGPVSDPAGITGAKLAKDALAKIAAAGAPFASRGDGSGTYTKERSLWTLAGLSPQSGANGYKALGQGMGETLLYSNETGSYTITDRGTWLAFKAKLPNLVILVGGNSIKENPDKALYNPYGVIAVNPAKFPKVNYAMAKRFIEWITSPAIQQRIRDFGRAQYGQVLFYPVVDVP